MYVYINICIYIYAYTYTYIYYIYILRESERYYRLYIYVHTLYIYIYACIWWWFSHYVVSHCCDRVDCSPPGSSVHGILQARILERVAISFSRGSSQPKNLTRVSCIVGRWFTNWAMREVHTCIYIYVKCICINVTYILSYTFIKTSKGRAFNIWTMFLNFLWHFSWPEVL